MAGTKYTRKPVKKVAKKNQSITQTGVKKKSVLSRALKNTAKGLGKGAMAVASMSPAGKGVKAAKLIKKVKEKIKRGKDSSYDRIGRAERKAIRDDIKSKGVTTIKDGVKTTKYPYAGDRVGDYIRKRPRKFDNDPSPAAMEKILRKENAIERALAAKTLRQLRKERDKPLTGKLKFKKGGAVKSKCKIDGIAQRGRTRAKRK
jgi:hypothetical protein